MATPRRRKWAIVLGAMVFVVGGAILSRLCVHPWLEHHRAMGLLAEYQANPCHETVVPLFDLLAQSRASQADGDRILAEMLKPKEITSEIWDLGFPANFNAAQKISYRFVNLNIVHSHPEIGIMWDSRCTLLSRPDYVNQLSGRYSPSYDVEYYGPDEPHPKISPSVGMFGAVIMGVEIDPASLPNPRPLKNTLDDACSFMISKPGVYKGTMSGEVSLSLEDSWTQQMWHSETWLEKAMRIVRMKKEPSEPRKYSCSFKMPFEVRATEADWSTTEPAESK